jgi:hypothetical protein
MRVRAFVAVAILALPGLADAQRIPIRVGRGGVGGRIGGAEPPPMAPAIARQMAYRRLALSVESYPLISYMNAPSYATDGYKAHWASFGAGTRMDYRVSRFASVTLDLTSTVAGGPLEAQTVELGTRLHRQRTESRAYPFMDLRVGYVQAYNNPFPSIDGIALPSARRYSTEFRYSRGFGAIAGVGSEFALTRRFSLTAGASLVRSDMRSISYRGTAPGNPNFMMSAYRFVLGLTYNPIRFIRPTQ